MDSFVLFSFAWITSSLSVSLAELTASPPASSEVKMKVPQLFGYAEDAYRLPSGIAFEDFYRNMTTKYPQMISIASPQYPLPYPVERNTHFKLTVTNSTGMEIFVHKMDIDPLTDFIKLTPLNSDGSERRSVILTGKLKAPIKFRSIGFTTVDVTFGAWTDVNHSFTGFFLSYTPYGNISYTPARIPQAPPELEEVGTISKFLTIPYAQQTKATWHRLKQLLAESANDYINSNRSLILEMATPDNVTFVYVTKCSDNWPNSVDCIDLEFAIILYNDTEKMATDIDPFMQENSLRVPAGLNSQQLEEMWEMFALKNLEQGGFQLYVLPDLHSEILMWSGLFLGAMVGILMFFVAICRWKLVRNQLIEDDTIDDRSEERKPHDKEVREDEDITMFASPIQMSSEFYQAKESDSGNSNIRRFDMSNGTDLAEGNVQLSNQNQSHGYETITEASCEDEDEPKRQQSTDDQTHADVSV